jgi:hypothetical protein
LNGSCSSTGACLQLAGTRRQRRAHFAADHGLFHLTNAAIDYLSAQASALQLTLNLQRDLVTITISGDGAAAKYAHAQRHARTAGRTGRFLAVTQSTAPR